MLLFKKRFLDAIRAGDKTQTIRLWPHRRMRAGQRSYIPGVGYIEVLSVDEVALDDLTDADARPDGFLTAVELRAEIAKIYSEPANADQRAFRVCFRVLSADEQGQARAEKRRRDSRPKRKTT
jgi:hypothetical protein